MGCGVSRTSRRTASNGEFSSIRRDIRRNGHGRDNSIDPVNSPDDWYESEEEEGSEETEEWEEGEEDEEGEWEEEEGSDEEDSDDGGPTEHQPSPSFVVGGEPSPLPNGKTSSSSRRGNSNHKSKSEDSLSSISEEDVEETTYSLRHSAVRDGKQALIQFAPQTELMTPEQFVFSDFDVATEDEDEKSRSQTRLRESYNRRRSQFVIGEVDIEDELEQEASIVQKFMKQRRGTTHAVSSGTENSNFLWGDFQLNSKDMSAQDEIRKQFGKKRKEIRSVTIKNHLGMTDRVKCLALLPKSEASYACAAHNDISISLYDIETGAPRISFVGHQDPLTTAVFSPNCKHIATCSADGGCVVWDTVTSKAQSLLVHSAPVICCAFTANSRFLVTSCRNGVCQTWEYKKQKAVKQYDEHVNAIAVTIDTHPRYDVAASGGVDGIVRLWTTITATTKALLRGHDRMVISVRFSPQGTRIVSNDEETIRIWNTLTTVCITSLNVQSLTTAIHTASTRKRMWIVSAFCPVGVELEDETTSLHVIATSSDKSVHIVQATTGREVYSFTTKGPAYTVAAGSVSRAVVGDCYGNIYTVTVK